MISKKFLIIRAFACFYIIMPQRRTIKGRLSRCNVEEQGVANAPEVKPQEQVTNVEFHEVIRMLSKVLTNNFRHQRGSR